MSTLPIPHLQACAPFSQHLPGKDIFQLQESCQTQQKTPNSPVAVDLQAIASTSSAVSLLADIDFSKPVSSSTTQPTATSVTQIPASHSYPSVSTVGVLHTNSASFGTQASISLASDHSFDVATDLDNEVLSKNILQNSNLLDATYDVVPGMLRINSRSPLSETIRCSNNTSTNVDVNKSSGILEPVRSMLFLMIFFKFLIPTV